MKKITDLGEMDVIHCPTEVEAIAICKIIGDDTLITAWYFYQKDACYEANAGLIFPLDACFSNKFTIHPAKDFLTDESRLSFIKSEQTIVSDGFMSSVCFEFKMDSGCKISVGDKIKRLLTGDVFSIESILVDGENYIPSIEISPILSGAPLTIRTNEYFIVVERSVECENEKTKKND